MIRKMVFGILIIFSFLFAGSEEKERVYFPPDTPHLEKVYQTLTEHHYLLVEDSTGADWKGSLIMTAMMDSIQYEIFLENPIKGSKSAGMFYLKPVGKDVFSKEMQKFFYWFGATTLVIGSLFFIRF
ncbi:MAG: hypothetical protein PHE86_00675 [Candidatus Marinimicrobia bacterium]|nr:hypothetical protein [Candidatus Neomarinimicrobiota bacterium]MDD5581791.1 hypothetical protein [Candidatus Neomarinimicrobiota bacterium]